MHLYKFVHGDFKVKTHLKRQNTHFMGCCMSTFISVAVNMNREVRKQLFSPESCKAAFKFQICYAFKDFNQLSRGRNSCFWQEQNKFQEILWPIMFKQFLMIPFRKFMVPNVLFFLMYKINFCNVINFGLYQMSDREITFFSGN